MEVLSVDETKFTLDRVTNISEFRKPERLTCQIFCLNLLSSPAKCASCSMHFCQECINIWLNKKNECPHCRTQIILEKCEKTLKEDLDDLKIECLFKCGTVVKYENAIKHQRDECDLKPIKCKWCEFSGVRKEVKAHENECNNRKILCVGCNQEIGYATFNEHQLPCVVKELLALRDLQAKSKKVKKVKFTESKFFKHNHIKLDGEFKAQMTKDSPGISAVICCKNKLQNEPVYWKVKISNLKCWIAIGITNYLSIVTKNFLLSDAVIENAQHGCFMISSNEVTWTLSWEDNYKHGISFDTNSEIEVFYQPNIGKICFKKVNSPESFTMILTGAPNPFEFYPVFVLGSTGDAVEIVSSSFGGN